MRNLIAHRGLKNNEIKENTLESFKRAIQNNQYCGFECDIRTTKDHVFVILHNPIQKDSIISLSYYKDLKKKYNIPKLEEVLSLKSNKIFLLEIKEHNLDVTRFTKILAKYKEKNIYVMSFFNSVIKKLNQPQKHYKIGVLNYVLNSEENYQDYDFICLLEKIATPKLIHFFEEKQIETFLYGIANIKNLEILYPKTYLITDQVFQEKEPEKNHEMKKE